MNSTETDTRKSIVDNISALVEWRVEDRKKRKLKTDDQVTETIKQIGRKIAGGEL